jgi:diguanylate cyclase (GGDEF)-like protein
MLFVLFVSFIFMTLTLEKQLSFEKVDNLLNQKKIISSLTKLKKDKIDLALIQFNGKTAQLQSEIDKLHAIYKYSITEQYILGNQEEYKKQLTTLSRLTSEFAQNANDYYDEDDTKKQEAIDLAKLKKSFYALNKHIDALIFENIEYDRARFNIFRNLSVFFFVVVVFASLWYRKRINAIYKDIQYLQSLDKQQTPYQIFSQEADAINLRMKRKVVVTDNPAFKDQITGINNYKGLVNSYGAKKGMKDSNFTSVCVFMIDNFSKSHRPFAQDLTQAILKKIAFTISLHEQATDVIARTDYNQFTVIFSRASKEQLFKEMDLIRQSIAELKFNTPTGETITVTGAFVIKPNNTNLEEALKQSLEILKHANKFGKNKILQTRDISENSI